MQTVQFEDGDIVFRRGIGMASQAVLLSEKNSMYSHAGLVFIIKHCPYVIHAVPGESGSEAEVMKCEKLTSFLDYHKATRAAIYRCSSNEKHIGAMALKQAKIAFDKRLKFDDAYDLDSDDKLYCTELIWKSYRAAGIDLIKGRFDLINIPLYKGLVILPGSFIHSESLTEIYSY